MGHDTFAVGDLTAVIGDNVYLCASASLSLALSAGPEPPTLTPWGDHVGRCVVGVIE